MLRKLPAALMIAALLIAIPAMSSLVSGTPDAAALTPGGSDAGILTAEERVNFWLNRLDGDADYLNRIQMGVALLELARQSSDLDVYDQALAMADEALVANATSADARILRAAALAAAHRFDEALVEANAVLLEQPTSFQAHSVAGDALLELGRFDEARSHLDALVAGQPQAPAALARLAEFSWDTGDEADALGYSEQALSRANEAALSPGQLSFYAIRTARFRLDTGDTNGAMQLASAALEIAPQVPAVHSTLGSIHCANSDLGSATTAYENAVEIAPLREALVALVELHTLTGNGAALAKYEAGLDAIGPPLGEPSATISCQERGRLAEKAGQ